MRCHIVCLGILSLGVLNQACDPFRTYPQEQKKLCEGDKRRKWHEDSSNSYLQGYCELKDISDFHNSTDQHVQYTIGAIKEALGVENSDDLWRALNGAETLDLAAAEKIHDLRPLGGLYHLRKLILPENAEVKGLWPLLKIQLGKVEYNFEEDFALEAPGAFKVTGENPEDCPSEKIATIVYSAVVPKTIRNLCMNAFEKAEKKS